MGSIKFFGIAICLVITSEVKAFNSFCNIPPSTEPPDPMSGFSIAYNPELGKVVLFGGQDSLDILRNETWVWTEQSGWRPSETKTNPPPRINAAMEYFPPLKGIVLFGGLTELGCTNDLWLYKNDKWEKIELRNLPSSRQLTTMVYNQAESKLILFGGKNDTNKRLGDTWVFANSEWTKINGELTPTPRSAHCMVYYPVKSSVLLYGGYDGNSLGDAWQFKNDQWERTCSLDGPPRIHASLVFNGHSNELLLMGGFGDQGRSDELWAYRESSKMWNLIELKTKPGPRAEHDSVFIPNTGTLMFGGVIGTDPMKRQRSNETWIYAGSWKKLEE